jgi:uroporphyrinogen-III decarboxylase
MGEEKTMDVITDLIVEHIKEIGEGGVSFVCMDGTWKGVFVLNQKEVPDHFHFRIQEPFSEFFCSLLSDKLRSK